MIPTSAERKFGCGMSLLRSCCAVRMCSVIAGWYTLISYLIAFGNEIFWIHEMGGAMPFTAYILAVVYLMVFSVTLVLLAGIFQKRFVYLAVWLAVVLVIIVPEGLLVFFMSFHFWDLQPVYSVGEVTFWACRIVINIAGLTCIQSLYMSWKESHDVQHKMEALNNMIPVMSTTVMRPATPREQRRPSVSSTVPLEEVQTDTGEAKEIDIIQRSGTTVPLGLISTSEFHASIFDQAVEPAVLTEAGRMQTAYFHNNFDSMNQPFTFLSKEDLYQNHNSLGPGKLEPILESVSTSKSSETSSTEPDESDKYRDIAL